MGQEILKRKDYYWEIGSKKSLVTITLLNIWETCKEGKKQTGIDDMQKAIHIFEWVGSENLANNYKTVLAKIV